MANMKSEDNILYAGKHLLIDMFEYEYKTSDELIEIFSDACKDANATVLYSYSHPFPGGGTSGVIILAESHLTWHEWPEENLIVIDIFMCGECEPEHSLNRIRRELNPKNENIKIIKRGEIKKGGWINVPINNPFDIIA